ncbi:MAG: diaminopimelate decarboxylase [Clostridiales bacterium]|nr:diaminopimelate decarboxylase [Clostridiales bacterium]
MNERSTLTVNEKGHLEIGGADCVELAKTFGTPLYVMDEAYIRRMMRVYRRTIDGEYNGNGMVLYASKAFSCKAIYRIAEEENIGVDVVSGGELFTALQAGFPAEKIYMHGNNKLPHELEEGLNAKVGCIVADGYEEIDFIDREAGKRGIRQKILLRVNPGVEAHTHAFVQTATTDSKFGFSLQDGTAEAITAYALTKENVCLEGYHCHIGSQIFEKQSFSLAVKKCMEFVASMREKVGFIPTKMNFGGGYGIWYTDEDRKLTPEEYAEYVQELIQELKKQASEKGLPLPYLLIEPGRSIVGEAGITLYTVGAIKEIPGVKTYVAVDGGMFDNPRYALYQSKYTPILANRAKEENTQIVSIAGKCCESGDLIAVNVNLPKAKRGDILAVFSTGAYNYSMAMNYNRNLIPPCVLVKDGVAEYIVKPQTYEDLVRNDVIPERLKKE